MPSLAVALLLAAQDAPSYGTVHEIFQKNCVSCHNAKDKKGELILESYESLKKGGESGPAVAAGKADESLLVKLVEHREKPAMPPPKKGEKLKPAEIAAIRAWIDAGAPAPPAGAAAPRAAVPRIEPKVAPRRAIHAAAGDPKANRFALGRAGEVELRSGEQRAAARRLAGIAGNVNALTFSADGTRLAAAAGEPGVAGEAHLWTVADGKLRRVFRGHADALHAVALSPDGKLLATGGYDRDIILWDAETGKPLRTLEGHNEAVFDLSFRPDGKILASASADRTVKLWDVATGKRRDTLTEATKALHAVAFSRDGSRVAAGGVDNRIRVWRVSADAAEGTNEIAHSTFAHEGSILRLAFSPDGKQLLSSADDRTVKLWNFPDMTPARVFEPQPDWPSAIAFAGGAVVVGRLDGSFAAYDPATGKAAVGPKPELAAVEPRGLQRGTTGRVKLAGKNLAELAGVKTQAPGLAAELAPEAGGAADAAWVVLRAAPDAAPGPAELWVWNAAGESGRVTVHVDTIPQVAEREPNDAPSTPTEATLPASFWGTLASRGDADHYAFEGRAGETVVLDVAARRLGSKADVVVTLADAGGRVLTSNIDFEGEPDPLLAYTLPGDGRYVVRIADLQLAASAEHFYRLSAGRLPVVTACYPLGVPAGAETRVRLVGYNLPPEAAVTLAAGGPGEVALPVDAGRFRLRRPLRVIASAGPEPLEAEDNDRPGHAQKIAAPGAVNGRIDRPGDPDPFRFEARKGQRWVIETQAAQRGSPVDTRVEILHEDGRPVERLLLRSVRDSYITFRPIDSNANGARLWQWEEMDLNQYLYMQGEVVRLFLAPRGPDSQWDFYTLGGKRVCYFDTSPTAHALDEACYIVEPHPPGSTFPPNGLPTFSVPYANDDDALRKLGTDSRLHFTAPADGAYLVRVTDTRGFGGDRYVYRLVLRPAKPDFRVTVEGLEPNIPAGSGRSFTVRVDRIDGFEDAVRVEVEGAPPGYAVSSPVVVEAGHFEAKGAVFAAADAPKPAADVAARTKVTARAKVDGRDVVKDVGSLGALGLAPVPKVRVTLAPDGAGASEIVVTPGKLTPAVLRIEREAFKDRVTFDVENLPFGIIVADIGLNGVLIPEGQTERRIFLQCAPWVEPTERPVFARTREVGNPTSRPILVRVPSRK
jgi:mono/diheme cytochrome c family protein